MEGAFGEGDEEDGICESDADAHDDADGGLEVEGSSGEEEGEGGPCENGGEGGHCDGGEAQGLEKGDEEQEDHDDGDAEA